ncbi:hypothetical protein [Actinokineospora cianjurensis]|uniref:Uncharacterized protein n=1 Tax=Actinokineospora cianjurensis TaxID=585224 RepID=A0A421AY81_9PSEU|nr:hypothetical protein [Actinokineospora cianjurensis]RLK54796.1 hypothetical protein CLV68_5182 [Actinokineospora cianjurensis]
MRRSTVARYYLPWPAPVQAAHYTDPAVLPAISHWVTALRQQGKVSPNVTFTLTTDTPPTATLTDDSGQHVLLPKSYLVLNHHGLHVLDPHTFHRHYQPPTTDREWST